MIPSLLEDVRRTSSETSEPSRVPFRVLRNNSAASIDNLQSNASNVSTPNPHFPLASTGHRISPDDTEHMMTIRHAILAALPIPIEIPMDDALSPVNIPPPFTLHEFLGTTTGVSERTARVSLCSINLFQSLKNSSVHRIHPTKHVLIPSYASVASRTIESFINSPPLGVRNEKNTDIC